MEIVIKTMHKNINNKILINDLNLKMVNYCYQISDIRYQISNIKYQILKQNSQISKMQVKSFICMRHAECDFNYSENKGKIGYSQQKEKQRHRYDPIIMDISISVQGLQSCEDIKSRANLKSIDIVLTSPLMRTLQTAINVFGDSKHIQIIVQPLLSEHMRSAADISTKLTQAQQKYADRINFNKIIIDSQEWQLNHIIPVQKHEAIKEKMKKTNNIHKAILSVMQQEGIQSLLELKDRVEFLKKQLAHLMQRYKNKNIVLLSHSNILNMLTATNFFEDGEPINAVQLDYCQIKPVPILLTGVHLSTGSHLCGC